MNHWTKEPQINLHNEYKITKMTHQNHIDQKKRSQNGPTLNIFGICSYHVLDILDKYLAMGLTAYQAYEVPCILNMPMQAFLGMLPNVLLFKSMC